MATAVFVVVVLLRFFVPLAIPRYPLPAILAALVREADAGRLALDICRPRWASPASRGRCQGSSTTPVF